MKPLTPKQEQFCKEYTLDLNATQAAARAGYKDPNIGRQLITKNNVAAKIEELKAERAKRAQLTADWVLEQLKRVANLAEEKKDYSAMNRSLELIGKHIGMFKEQVDVTSKGEALQAAKRDLDGMSAAELAALYRQAGGSSSSKN